MAVYLEPEFKLLPDFGSDRWMIWPVATSVVAVSTLTLLCSIPDIVGFITILLLALICAVAVVATLVAFAVLLASRRLRRALSLLLAIIVPFALRQPINWGADCIHLVKTVGFGRWMLGTSTESEKAGFTAYDWSVGLAGGTNTFLILDPSDEISVPWRLHKNPHDSQKGFDAECAGQVEHLLGHYYVCSF